MNIPDRILRSDVYSSKLKPEVTRVVPNHPFHGAKVIIVSAMPTMIRESPIMKDVSIIMSLSTAAPHFYKADKTANLPDPCSGDKEDLSPTAL